MTRSRLHFLDFQFSRFGTNTQLKRPGHKSSAFLSTSTCPDLGCGCVRRVCSPRRPRTKCICLAVRVWLIFKQLPPLAAKLLEQFKYIVITIITNTNGEQIRTPSPLIPHTQRSSKVLVIRFWPDKYECRAHFLQLEMQFRKISIYSNYLYI